jgi:Cys-tRNA(Pro)/Cys-tRNA(Cys) deacylase
VHARVAEALRANPVEYTIHRHDAFSAPIRSPADFAAALSYDLGRITKTLLVRSSAGDVHAIVVAPMGKKIDFRGVASLLGVKRIEVASGAELGSLTGYPEQGVSPLGVPDLRILMDQGLFDLSTILIGAGEAGVEIEINPADLARVTGAIRAPLAAG